MMPTKPRATYHHGNLSDALLAAGEAVLAERGAQGLTLRECARRAGVSHAAPTHHFGNRKSFLSALAERGYRHLAQLLSSTLQARPQDDLDAQLLATAEAYVGFARAQPELFRLMFRFDLLDSEAPGLSAAARTTFVVLTNVIRQQRGEAPLNNTELGALRQSTALREDVMLGWCHIHGFAHLLIEGQFAPMRMSTSEERFVQQALTNTMPRLGRALRSPPAPMR